MAIILKKSFKQPPKPPIQTTNTNHQLTQKSPIHGSSESTKKTMPKKCHYKNMQINDQPKKLILGHYMEDHPRFRITPIYSRHEVPPFGRGCSTRSGKGTKTITMVINCLRYLGWINSPGCWLNSCCLQSLLKCCCFASPECDAP